MTRAEMVPENRTQARAEAIVAAALAEHGHAVSDPGRFTRPRLIAAPRSSSRACAAPSR